MATLRVQLYRGLITRVAESLDVNKSSVSRVARGLKTSRSILKALRDEERRIERELERGAA